MITSTILKTKIESLNNSIKAFDTHALNKSLFLISQSKLLLKDLAVLGDIQIEQYLKDIETKEKEVKQSLNEENVYKSRLQNLKNDLNTIQTYETATSEHIKIDREKDLNDYKLLNKQIHYKDISPLQILKLLLSKHKINNFIYKDCVKRLKNNQRLSECLIILKRNNLYLSSENIDSANEEQTLKAQFKKLPDKVVYLFNSYYGTIKANTSKNTLKKLKQKEFNKPFDIINKNGINYKVILKKNYYFHKYYLKEVVLSNRISDEFNKKFAIDNHILNIDLITKTQ